MKNFLFGLYVRCFKYNEMVKGFILQIRLKVLGWCYGGVNNIPHDKINAGFTADGIESLRLMTITHFATKQVLKLFQVQEIDSVFLGALYDAMRMELHDPKLHELIGKALESSTPRLTIMEVMTTLGDIAPHKVDFFVSSMGQDKFNAWINAGSETIQAELTEQTAREIEMQSTRT